ncbi:MAG: proton-conducting transporter membrane subunit, partial [bacterium]
MPVGLGASVLALLPELVLVGAAIVLILLDLPSRRSAGFAAWFGATAGLGALLALAWGVGNGIGGAFGGQIVLDDLALAGRLLVAAVLVLTLLVSLPLLERLPGRPAEYAALLLFAASGLMGVTASRNWLVLFIFLEMSALSVAALLASRSDAHAGREASLKYFILSAFASAFLLYGIALQFLSTGSFVLSRAGAWEGAGPLALAFILAGLAFKCALVPFHMWAPDVYEGGPTPVAAFLAC